MNLIGVLLVLSSSSNAAFAQRTLAITGARILTAGENEETPGSIENATMLVRDGKIVALGQDVKVPVSAQVLRADGKTITPGFVDPYYVIPLGRSTPAAQVRTVVFRGRTFVVSGGTPAIATAFARVADGFDAEQVDWRAARRSGITTYHVVAAGYAQSILAQANAESVALTTTDGKLLVAATNDTKTLDVLRKGLKTSASQENGAVRQTSPRTGTAGKDRPGASSTSSGGGAPAAAKGPPESLWSLVKEGKSPIFLNVNNPAAILHANAILANEEKVEVALIASGQSVYSALEEIDSQSTVVVLPPTIDEIPNSRLRVNIPRLLVEKKIPFAISLSLGRREFAASQDSPMFAMSMLVRAGLERTLALRALTIVPAKLLGIEDSVGSLEVGKRANFVVFQGDPFAATTGIDQVFIEGKPIHED